MQDEKKHRGRKVFRRFANKYTLVGGIFAVWLLLFDKYNFVTQMELRTKINDLEKERKYYREKIEDDRRKQEELLGDKERLEKFAREEYLMKRENEDIFIIVNE